MKYTACLLSLLALASTAAAADCTPKPLEIDTSMDGSLTSECKLQDVLPASALKDLIPLAALSAQAFTITMPEGGGVLTLTLSSPNFPPVVLGVDTAGSLAGIIDGSTTIPATLTLSLRAGANTIAVASASTAAGPYILKSSFSLPRACAPTELTLGGTIPGELTPDDCRELDYVSPSSSQRPVDLYKFTVTETSIATFILSSTAFDSFLTILDAKTMASITEDDDTAGNGNAGILLSLPPGDYLLAASSAQIERGAYSLRTLVEPARTCLEESIAVPGSVRGTLAAPDCRFLDYVPFTSDFSFLKPYRFEVPRRSLVTIDLTSTQFDAYLNLLRADKTYIAGDDDGGGNSNSRIVVTLDPGAYVILANTYEAEEIGAFDLKTAASDPISCPSGDLPPVGSLSSAINNTDCRLREILTEVSAPNRAKQFKLSLPQDGALTIDITTAAFAPGAVLVNGAGRVVSLNTQRAQGIVRISGTLAAGDYTVLAYTNDGNIGAFSLKSTFQ